MIRKKVSKAVTDAGNLYKAEEGKVGEVLSSAVLCISDYWGTRLSESKRFDVHQIRHSLIAGGFALTGLLGFNGEFGHDEYSKSAAYIIGSFTLFSAIVSIRVMRTGRDNKLRDINDDLEKALEEKRARATPPT